VTKEIAVIIPALNPDEKLVSVVHEIRSLFDPLIVIVNDGSDSATLPFFETLQSDGCIVLRHEVNRGKGAALKTAFRFIADIYPDVMGTVTADADGQHSATDILRIAEAIKENQDCLILGERCFSGEDVPFKSRWGNRITAAVFYLQTGIKGLDTQTGLRGIGKALFGKCLEINGERFEYEMNMLLVLAKNDVPFVRIPIKTVYLEENRSSHFRAVRDSAYIYLQIFKFSMSSLVCAAVDVGLFALFRSFVFHGETGIMISTITARILSGICNFLINKNVVFKKKNKGAILWIEYGALFIAIMLASGEMTKLFSATGMPEIVAKIITDLILFSVSFIIQKKFIFKKNEGGKA
jgi:glycosyltransferase involved in cell wall biosynthesis